jgi:hypothetical protein
MMKLMAVVWLEVDGFSGGVTGSGVILQQWKPSQQSDMKSVHFFEAKQTTKTLCSNARVESALRTDVVGTPCQCAVERYCVDNT